MDGEDYGNNVYSSAFLEWCQELDKGLARSEQRIASRIAESQRYHKPRPRVYEAVLPDSLKDKAAERGLYPIRDDPSDRKVLLFAPLDTAEIESLEKGEHEYHSEDGGIVPLRLKRSSRFIEPERDFAAYFSHEGMASWAKREYLPLLTFPFLPYSRKFLDVEFGAPDGQGAAQVPANLDLGRIVLEDGVTARDRGLLRDWQPFWNVFFTTTNVGAAVERDSGPNYSWRPRADDPLSPGRLYVLHRAFDGGGKPVPIELREGAFVSDTKFMKLQFSVVGEFSDEQFRNIEQLVEQRRIEERFSILGREDVGETELFWYRNFLQSLHITKKDVSFLLGLLPETRNRLTFWDSFLAKPSPQQYQGFVEKGRWFYDYLWYLGEAESFGHADPDTMRFLRLLFRRKKVPDREAALAGECANYMASICRQFLPPYFECRGFLED